MEFQPFEKSGITQTGPSMIIMGWVTHITESYVARKFLMGDIE